MRDFPAVVDSRNGHGEAWTRITETLGEVVDGRSAVLLLEGEAGIGRTRLLADVAKTAGQMGIAVCAGRGDELTRWTPLAPLAAALGQTVWASGDSLRLATQLLQALHERASAGPLMIVLDDVQWVDPMTLAALRSFPAQLSPRPVVWVLASRDGTGDAAAAGRLFDRLAADGALRIRLTPLRLRSVVRVVTDFFGAAPDTDLLSLCASSNGNPALVAALLEGLREENAVVVRDGRAVLEQPRLPQRLISAVRNRLDGFGADTIGVLEVAAILGRSFRLADVAEVLGRSLADVLRAIREVLRAGLLDSDEQDDALSFRHGLVWRAVGELVAPSVAAPLHRQIGLLMIRRTGASGAATDHLLRGALPGDTQAIEALVDAAERALHGAPRTAADISAKALRLAMPGSPEFHALTGVRANALLQLGKLTDVEELVSASLACRVPAAVEANLRTILGAVRVLTGRYASAVAEIEQALAVPEGDAGVRASARATMLAAAAARGDRGLASRLAEQVLVEYEAGSDVDRPDRDDEVAVAVARVMLSRERWAEGEMAEALELLRAATRCPASAWWNVPAPHPRLVLAAMLAEIGDLTGAEAEIAAAETEIELTEHLVHSLSLHIVRGWVRVRAGSLSEAETEAAAGIELSDELGVTWFLPLAATTLATAALRRGDLVEAQQHLERGDGTGPVYAHGRQAWAELQIAAAQHSPRHVLSMLDTTHAHLLERPSQLLLQPSAAAWLVRLALEDRDDEIANRVASHAELLAERNPTLETLTAAADHVRGLLDRDTSLLRKAASSYGDPWSRGVAWEDLALVHADGQEAVEALESAMTAYEEAGCSREVARVRRLLREAGVRRRHWTYADRPATGWESLTPTERDVVELVAEGLTNRQVAARMFVSPHTVHAHLGRVFRKLGVSSRVELTGLRHRIA
ncbi:helix-turn-helix transcriptional regulator [Lentzea sp. NBRC 105346]|uniref:helix-turn-helix transcriptional regulator n=1 Tax=Lentzea sp. NBRC 105346 TaxID=3032205 RepID=UPI0024A49677|nr:LuxR family transcriptional regulator [Lentzea sp. NBRC 105346]GLZ29111.1 helix-turn-helix transcriptional regulator [Lentzea sp. NBRC 105346]